MNQNDKYITILQKETMYDKTKFNKQLLEYPILQSLYEQCKQYKTDIMENIVIDIQHDCDITPTLIANKYLKNRFISDKIKQDCMSKSIQVDTYTFQYKTNSIIFYNCVFRTTTQNVTYKQYIVMACYGFIIMEIYNKQHITIPVYVVPSKYKKKFPINKAVTHNHINSGYTSFIGHTSEYCVLFRKEDIENIFVHECIHFIGIDKPLFSKKNIHLLHDLFPVQSPILLNEAYSEILTIVYVSLCNALFLQIDYKTILYNEWIYTLFQCNKLLHLYSIRTISDFHKWVDKTNAFTYVFIKAICFEHISLCLTRLFDYTHNTNKRFIQYIHSRYSHVAPYLYKHSTLRSNFLNRTFKKSIYNIKW
jgi:hypothetical protein